MSPGMPFGRDTCGNRTLSPGNRFKGDCSRHQDCGPIECLHYSEKPHVRFGGLLTGRAWAASSTRFSFLAR